MLTVEQWRHSIPAAGSATARGKNDWQIALENSGSEPPAPPRNGVPTQKNTGNYIDAGGPTRRTTPAMGLGPRAELASNPNQIDELLDAGAAKARKKASDVLRRAQKACGISGK